ncbi:L-seryl-tRNA(Sec) selenium transferase, partial [Streptomyces coelicoflavus]|nr:L-seryl-tRNA(Sec) selenium transferase [Streptomyces coelicoflavus]
MEQRDAAERRGERAAADQSGAAGTGEAAHAVPDARRRIPRTDALLRDPRLL